MSRFEKIKDISGIDFHIVLTLLMRSWTALAGGIMLIGIPYWFNDSEQGYYFTFYSLLGLQVFFELGLNYVVVQIVGHESANLRWADGINWNAPSSNLDRLTSLIRLIKKWYLIVAVLFFVIVTTTGIFFFKTVAGDNVVGWEIGWILLVIGSAANLYLSPLLAIAEGIGMVGQVARLKLFQSAIGYGLLWILLSNGAGLVAVPIVLLVAIVCSTLWLKRTGKFIGVLEKREITDIANHINWRSEILPFQWRIALSWISGYLIFQIFNPLIFAYQGAKEAGRIGLALTVFSTLLSISMSWVMAKVPDITGHIARNEKVQAKKLLQKLIWRSGIFNLFGAITILIAVWVMKETGISIGNRIAELPTLICVALAAQINHFIGSIAAYIRAHKVEPLLKCSIVVGLLSLCVVFIGAQHSAFLTMLLYFFITAFVALPWLLLIYRKFETQKNSLSSSAPNALKAN